MTSNQYHKPRIAIIGAGMIAAVHLSAARAAGAEIIGVLASTQERSLEVAKQWRLPRGYASMTELLADQPDVVHVCTPNRTHYDYTIAAVRAGINVVCEKPLSIDVEQAEELVMAVEAAGVVATVPFVYRYHPLVREIRARRISGELGDIKLVHGSYLQDWLMNEDDSSWRVDPAEGGRSRAFADIGSHWCDLAEFITGLELTSVFARTSIAYPTRPGAAGPSFSGASATTERIEVATEDVAVALFTSDSGAPVNTVISQVSGGRKNRLWIEIDGSRSSAVFDQENPGQVWFGTQYGGTVVHRGEGRVSGDQDRLNVVPAGHPQGYVDAFTAFVSDTYAAVAGGSPEGLPTFADGLRSVRVTQAVMESARAGAVAEIDSPVPAVGVGSSTPTRRPVTGRP